MKTDSHWKKIGLYPHHGICLPLFSLRTKKSCGIGEFCDLIPLIDWCKNRKLDCIQLLPLNDSGSDPSPYNALSSIALDPVYLSLAELPDIGSLLLELDTFLSLTQRERVDRHAVKEKKMEWLQRYFEKNFSVLAATAEYQAFIERYPEIQVYALFKAIKEEQGGKIWREWPSKLQTPQPHHFEKYQQAIDFHSFLQFHCFQQMGKVRTHATTQGVFLMGDIPILLSPDSADVWAHRSLFNLDLVAGAPPDYYVKEGQKWGFPLFNWDVMRQNGFAWWKRRLAVAEELYHLYRIDHVVGFFRIWGIPPGKKPIDGHFVPPDPHLWPHQGKELLEMMLDSCALLPVAEDLGTIPREVFPILKDLGICGTKVLRWQRHDGKYIPYREYEPFSLTTVSTPDLDCLEGWWKKFPREAVPFCEFKHWAYHPILSAKHRLEILRDVHHTPSYFHINQLQEYLGLFPELVYEDERVNIPGTLLPTNWTYRFRPFLEEIAAHEGLAKAFDQILSD